MTLQEEINETIKKPECELQGSVSVTSEKEIFISVQIDTNIELLLQLEVIDNKYVITLKCHSRDGNIHRNTSKASFTIKNKEHAQENAKDWLIEHANYIPTEDQNMGIQASIECGWKDPQETTEFLESLQPTK